MTRSNDPSPPPRTERSGRVLRRRATLRLWWSLTAVAMVLGIGVSVGAAGAQDEGGSAATVTIDRVDGTGEASVAEGSFVGGDPADLELTSDEGDVTVSGVETVGQGVSNEVVVVLDNAESLGNATVQLSKQAVAPLYPGQGATSTLGVVTTGGNAAVQVGPTPSDAEVAAGLDGVSPSGASATWDGLVRAADLLDDRAPGSVGTVVLFTASPVSPSSTKASAARAALQRAGVRLDVVGLPRGADLTTAGELVAELGGTIQVVPSDEELAGAFENVATGLASRFSIAFSDPEGADSLVGLTATAGDATTTVAYTPGTIRVGEIGLAPATSGGSTFLANPIVKWLIVLMGLAAGFMLVWSVATIIVPDENDLTSRLEAYDETFGVEPDPLDQDDSHSIPIIQRAVEFTGEMAEKRGVLDKVETMLERANLPLRAPEAMFFTAAIASVLVVLAFIVSGSVVIALVAAVLAVLLPPAVLNFRVARRQKAFVGQLPDMLALLAGTLRAGYSISQGFESVSTEVEDPMGRELRRVVTETRLGRSLEESLESVAERMDSDDFAWAVMAIKIQREVGGNLAELLMTVADTMTQRERLRRDVATLTAEGKLSAIIIGLLPPGLTAVLFVINPGYIGPLFTPGLGMMLVIFAAVMMIIGFVWMKKCITIEV